MTSRRRGATVVCRAPVFLFLDVVSPALQDVECEKKSVYTICTHQSCEKESCYTPYAAHSCTALSHGTHSRRRATQHTHAHALEVVVGKTNSSLPVPPHRRPRVSVCPARSSPVEAIRLRHSARAHLCSLTAQPRVRRLIISAHSHGPAHAARLPHSPHPTSPSALP